MGSIGANKGSVPKYTVNDIKKKETRYYYRSPGSRLTNRSRQITYWEVGGKYFRRKKDAVEFVNGGEDRSVYRLSLI